MVKNKHLYILLGLILLIGFSYFVFQFWFSNSVNLIDLNKSLFRPNELYITKFYKIPDTPYLFTKFTDHSVGETTYGYVFMGEQRITLIDLTDNSRIIDRYISHPSKSSFQMYKDSVFLINDEPMIQCRFLSIQSAIQSKISKFLNNISPFFMKRVLNAPYNHTFLSITKDDTEQIDLNDVYRHSFFALNGKHPLIKRNKGNGISSIDSDQQPEWQDEQWESIKTFNTLYFFQSSAERSNHGYTKNTWTVHKQGRLVVHDRENMESVLELPIDQVYQLVSPSNTNRISSLIYLNEGWNFGKSNLMFDLWKSWSNGAQTNYSLVEFSNEVSVEMNADDVLRVVKPNNKMIPFTSLQNDTVVLLSPDVELAFNCFILPGTSKLFAMTRKPGEEFSSELIEVDVPDDAVVSKFPINDELLLLYRDSSFWSMEWDTGEMTKLYSMN